MIFAIKSWNTSSDMIYTDVIRFREISIMIK